MGGLANHKQTAGVKRDRGILIVALLMILFGFAEVVTSFTHQFFGIATSQQTLAIVAGVAIGGFYFIGGLLILTGRKWAAAFAIVLLVADILGRVAMVLAGLYPVDSFLQIVAIVIGTLLAAIFAVYIGSKWRFFV